MEPSIIVFFPFTRLSIAELRRERLTYPLGKALRLRRALLAAVDDVEGELIPGPDDME